MSGKTPHYALNNGKFNSMALQRTYGRKSITMVTQKMMKLHSRRIKMASSMRWSNTPYYSSAQGQDPKLFSKGPWLTTRVQVQERNRSSRTHDTIPYHPQVCWSIARRQLRTGLWQQAYHLWFIPQGLEIVLPSARTTSIWFMQTGKYYLPTYY